MGDDTIFTATEVARSWGSIAARGITGYAEVLDETGKKVNSF